MKSLYFLLSLLALLPTLALAGESYPPRPAGKYGKGVPTEPVDEPLKRPKDPSLWWQGITDDDVFYPEWAAISARAASKAKDTNVAADANVDATAQKKKKNKKEKEMPKALQFAGKWKYCGCARWTNGDKCEKIKRVGGNRISRTYKDLDHASEKGEDDRINQQLSPSASEAWAECMSTNQRGKT
ncbi:hypothetical protein COCMIDRAFT_27061 [Bipolaris oryzae ATCC 44560]|uniref:Uncharacterized protein n=1 Tax=Bipolaris oryzae ATCC 44560 TaxID=930090 RepID=W6ZAY1_COCMI|nr:uncharacterized protein COCMIDRAFT_27061 [Bipolaris oryzae ATCC 44560]EUC44629.1 hypothetical protein COCMIDRAFT_27061 [Bipolaris oryzae ATCC 44560]